MNRPYRILIIEDLPSDAILVKRVLKKQFELCEFQLVDSKEEFLTLLPVFRPDIILSDYSIPGFDWLTAYQLSRDLTPPIPFIIVSGSTNPKIVADCLKSGAWDFVSKDNIENLVPAILRIFEKAGID